MNRQKRLMSVLFVAAFTLSLLSGCGAGTPAAGDASSAVSASPSATESTTAAETATPAPAKEPVKIIYWHTYGDAEDPFFNETVLADFKASNPTIEVEAVRQEGGQFNQLITTAFATGQTPDLARIDIVQTPAFANQDGLLALDGMPDFAALRDAVLEGPLSTNLFKGHYYGLPLDTNCKAAVMNMDVMKKLGFDAPPATMEAFIEASRKESKGKYTLNVSGVGDWDSYTYFWLFGGQLTDPQFTKATGFMDSQASIDALTEMVSLHADGVLTVRDIDGTPDAWDGIKTGEYAMFFEGPWYFAANADFKEKNILPSTIPTWKGKSASVVGGENIVVFKASKQPEAAFECVKFLLSEKTQMAMATVGQMPVLKSAVNQDAIRNHPFYGVYQQQLSSAFARIPSPQATRIVEIWSLEITKALTGEATPEAALKSAAAQIDAELAK